ncbi:MAG TPA: Hpt domain-containing protein, partial [Gammaproteobacteria bacterium]|nr:Hpt domain-containing protein [Gammaproteobacteria bacterium]
YIKQLIVSDNGLADESVLTLIEACSNCFSSLLDAVNQPDFILPDWHALLDRIEAQAQQLLEATATQEAASEPEPVKAPEEEIPVTGAEVIPLPVSRMEKTPAVSSEGLEFDEIEGEEDLIEIFSEEARELVESVEQSLQEWRAHPDNPAPLSDLQRTLHTLKGGARLSGVMAMGNLSHAFETLLSEVDQQQTANLAEIMELSQLVSDRLAEQIEDIGIGPRVRRSDDLIQRLERLSGGTEIEEAEPELPVTPSPEVLQTEDEQSVPEEPVTMRQQAVVSASPDKPATEAKTARGRREQIRVQADLLDKLVNNAGEVSIYRSRLEQQNNTLGFNLKELEQTVDRLRAQLRSLDIETEAQILFRYEREKEERETPETAFDPLEMDRFSTIQQLSRSLLETVNDLTNINGYLEDLNKETETLLLQQARVAADLQDGLLHTRMVPFSQQVPRLQRVVRQTAASLGKLAELHVKGAE